MCFIVRLKRITDKRLTVAFDGFLEKFCNICWEIVQINPPKKDSMGLHRLDKAKPQASSAAAYLSPPLHQVQ